MRRTLCCLLLLPALATAAEVRSLEVSHDDGVFVLDSLNYVAAPTEAVYAALLDYSQFGRLSSYIKESRYIEPAADGTPRVYTRATGCLLFVCREIFKTERLEVDGVAHIAAVVEPEGSNLSEGRSDWWVTAEADGTVLRYRVELVPDFWVPPVIGPIVIRMALKRAGGRAVERLEMLAREQVPEETTP
jgi:hypothetical protein